MRGCVYSSASITRVLVEMQILVFVFFWSEIRVLVLDFGTNCIGKVGN